MKRIQEILDEAKKEFKMSIPIERLNDILENKKPTHAGFQATQSFIEKIQLDIKNGIIK